jgi:hypothetical protein
MGCDSRVILPFRVKELPYFFTFIHLYPPLSTFIGAEQHGVPE